MRWFVPEFVARFAAIGITPTAIVGFAVTAEDDPLADPDLDCIDRIILPWDIDVLRVEFLIEVCDFCARRRTEDAWRSRRGGGNEPESDAGPGGPT
jgi:hypothetical protein